jgi:hypothetical protein
MHSHSCSAFHHTHTHTHTHKYKLTQITKRGELFEAKEVSTQFVSAAGDGTLIWWDSRVHATRASYIGKYEAQDTKEIKWLPLLSVNVWNPLTPEVSGICVYIYIYM